MYLKHLSNRFIEEGSKFNNTALYKLDNNLSMFKAQNVMPQCLAVSRLSIRIDDMLLLFQLLNKL